jgi:membrane protein implicated in regulation of membrane protease activity
VAHSAPTTRTARSNGGEEASVGILVQSAMADVSTLIRSEIELAKAEISQSAKKAGIGAGAFGAAGAMLAFAGLFFFVFLAQLLALWLPQWAAWLIVFGLLLLAAGLAALIGMRFVKKIDKPERTMESLRELPEVMKREAPGARHRDVPVVSDGQVQLRGDSYVV